MSLKEYKPGTAFSGVIGRTVDRSTPAWPEPLRIAMGTQYLNRGRSDIEVVK